MDHKQLIQSYREEVNKWRSKLSRLEVNSIEQRAYDGVRKWRQSFNSFSSSQIDRVLNEMDKRKQAEVSRLANELRDSLDQFKEVNLNRLAQLDAFISSLNVDDDIQWDYVKFELDSVGKKIDSLHVDILVQVNDKSKRLHSSTALARNTLELVKVFEFNTSQPSSSSPCWCFEALKNFVSRASVAGASYYNTGLLDQKKHL